MKGHSNPKTAKKTRRKWVRLEQLYKNWGRGEVLKALDSGMTLDSRMTLTLFTPQKKKIIRDDEKSFLFSLPQFNQQRFDSILQRIDDRGISFQELSQSRNRSRDITIRRLMNADEAFLRYWTNELSEECGDYVVLESEALQYAEDHDLCRGFVNSHHEKKKADDKTDIKSLPIVKQLYDSMAKGTRGVPGKGAAKAPAESGTGGAAGRRLEMPSTDPDNVLRGWKEIAKCLDVSVSTAQMYEREQEMPIYRNKRVITAYKSELSAWRLA